MQGARTPAIPVVGTARLETRRASRVARWLLGTLFLLLALLGATVALALTGDSYHARPLAAASATGATAPDGETARLETRLAALRPRGVHLVVDSYRNRLRVYEDGELVRDTVCSTGSGVVLRDPRNGRLWVFDTPTGERRVQRKVKDPVWVKPDWAFIEEGKAPPKYFRDRVDDFSLGEYGLYLGEGYIIHGTVFQTLLGNSVTHGCIRLGDADLEFVYQKVPVGARVLLY